MKSISETEPNSNDSTAEFSEEETAKAEEFKSKGNELFKSKFSFSLPFILFSLIRYLTLFCRVCLDNKFADSVEQYTEAIFCKISNTKKAVYYCNRSLASLK